MNTLQGRENGIDLRRKRPDKLRVCPLNDGHKIVCLPLGRIILSLDETLKRREILVIAPCHPQGLGLSKKRRGIVRSYVKSIIVVGQRGGVIIHGHLPICKS